MCVTFWDIINERVNSKNTTITFKSQKKNILNKVTGDFSYLTLLSYKLRRKLTKFLCKGAFKNLSNIYGRTFNKNS